MIANLLIAQLKLHFPDKEFSVTNDGQTIITFPAKNPEVGDLEIHDDGDEITLCLGTVTHVHIGNSDDQLSLEIREQKIADDVIKFIMDVFSENIEFYKTSWGGGCGPRGCGEGDIFVWSGPVTAQKP